MIPWTPVEKALPPCDGRYLVTWVNANGEPFVTESDFGSGEFWDVFDDETKAVAWMPLPEAYKP